MFYTCYYRIFSVQITYSIKDNWRFKQLGLTIHTFFVCRNHFYQQVRQDISAGMLKIPPQLTPCLLSYVLQGSHEKLGVVMSVLVVGKGGAGEGVWE